MRKITGKVDKYMTSPSKAIMESPKPIFPTIRIDLEHMPEAKKWKLGQSYNVEFELKLVGLSQSRFDNSCEFEIHGVETEDTKEEDSESEKE